MMGRCKITAKSLPVLRERYHTSCYLCPICTCAHFFHLPLFASVSSGPSGVRDRMVRQTLILTLDCIPDHGMSLYIVLSRLNRASCGFGDHRGLWSAPRRRSHRLRFAAVAIPPYCRYYTIQQSQRLQRQSIAFSRTVLGT